ncbi:MAG: hypothetical protein IKT98_06690 [Selenomonadaceae bacterium]|nr:hypothetical protein [Selenomonadaceae bacterium]
MKELVFNLQRFADLDLIEGTDDNDNFNNRVGSDTAIDGKAGDDYISFMGDHNSINGGDGNDDIQLVGDRNSINGGNDNDNIRIVGDNNTVSGGTGDDYIDIWNGDGDGLYLYDANFYRLASNNGFVYVYEGGNDIIRSFNKDNNFLVIEGYTWSTYREKDENDNDTDRFIVNVLNGEEIVGTITLENYWSDKVNIVSSKEELVNFNIVFNHHYETDTVLYGSDGKDIITNAGKNVSITSGAGNDSIYTTGDSVTIDAGNDDNYVLAHSGAHITIMSGTGNDKIDNGNGCDVVYFYKGGNDTLDNLADLDTIVLGDVKVKSSIQSDNGTMLRLSNGNYLYLLGGITKRIVSSLDEVPKINVTSNHTNNTVVTGKREEGTIDYIGNDADKVTINGGDEADYISNSGAKVSISGGAGDDNIFNGYNEGGNVSISGGNGNDYIDNHCKNVLINGDEGNDYIFSHEAAKNSKINGGDGDDDICNLSSDVLIDGGDGNDHISNEWQNSNATINGGNGDDNIWSDGNNGSINGGDGNDYITTNDGAYDNTIDGGAGDDTIESYGGNDLVRWSGGNDFITGFGFDDSLQIMSGTISAVGYEDGRTLLIVGENVITVEGEIYRVFNQDGKKIILASFNADAVTNEKNDTLVNGTGGDDVIANTGKNVTIDAGDGDNSIYNEGSNVSINFGVGNDYILNEGDNVSISTGAGNDGVNNVYAQNAANIDLGTGDDWVDNHASNSTILGGDGDDFIDSNASNVSIDAGEGNNHIVLFNEKHTVTAGAGNDTVDDNGCNSAIIDVGAGNDIINNRGENNSINGGEGNDFIHNEGCGDYSTILGGAGNDTIDNNGDTVKVDAGDGDDSIYSNSYYATISGGNGDDSILLNNEGHDYLIQYKSGDGNDFIEGFNETSTLSIAGSSYTSTTNDSDIIITVGEGSITLAGAAWNSSPNIVVGALEEEEDNDDTLEGGNNGGNGGNDTLPVDDNGATWKFNSKANKATYSESNKTLVTVSGVKSLNGLSIDVDNKIVTVGTAALNNSNVSISDGYALALADDVITPQTTAAKWSLSKKTAIYKDKSTSAGYSVKNNQIVYNAASGGETLLTVDGVKSLDGISKKGTKITIAKSSLNKSDVTISDGYTLALGEDVPTPDYNETDFDGLTYKSASNTAGYTLDDNKITYTKAKAATDLFTIKGVKNTEGITVDGKTVTVPKSALGTSKVIINNGYALAIADDVKTPKPMVAGWTLDGTTATYKKNSTSDGYTVNANNEIVYSPASEGDTLVTVRGVQSTNGLSLNKKVVTVSKVALGTDEVTISDGYILKLGGDVTKSATINTWNFNKSKATATYKQTATKGYALADDKKSITYTTKTNKKLVTVSGVKSASGLVTYDDKKVVTVGAKALDEKTVKISGNEYTLKLSSKVETPQTTAAGWTQDSKTKTATYKSASNTAGYKLAANGKSITYSKKTTAKTLASINGVKENATPTVKNKVITLKKANLSGSKVTVSGSYGFNFASGDYKNTSIVGSKNKDSITSNGSKLSITGGKGNDLISLSSDAKNNVIVYNVGDGNDTIYGFDGNDTLKIAKGTASVTTKGNDVIFTVGKGKITVKGGVGKTINYVDKNVEKTYPISKLVTLTEDYDKKTYTMSDELRTLDASAVQRDLEIIGNEYANKITGSNQNDIIKGGGANDTLKGGKGSDVFIYASGDGNDVITDYATEDKIQIENGTAKVTASGKDVIFTVGTGKISVKGAADKVVTYIDANSKVKYYPENQNSAVTVSGAGVTLKSSYKKGSFDVANYGSTIVTIDASPVSHNLKIFGNEKANVILGGYGNDTIIGGKNNDTLQGGDGKNVFLYNEGDGNDVIVDYNTGDKISLVSDAVISSSVKGDDVVLKVGKNKITLNNGVDKVITVVDAKGGNRIIGGTKDDNIKGGKGNDSLWGGKGADTLQGGKGNDSLWGNAGADTFIYANGDGDDTIYGFANDDMLKITGVNAKDITGTTNSKGTEVYFKVGKTTDAITLKNFTAKSFNVNGDSYKISGKKLVPNS